MPGLSEKQQNKLAKLLDVLGDGDLALLRHLLDVEEKLEAVGEREKGDKGERGDKGDSGESITGPQGPKGDKGDSIVGPMGPQGEDGKDGTNGTNGENGRDGSPDSGLEIVQKINELAEEPEQQIDIKHIKGWKAELKKEVSSIPRGMGGGGRSSHSTKFYDLSVQTDGIKKVFTVPKNIAAITLCSDFPSVLMEGNGFTLNSTRTELTLTTVNAPSQGAQLLFQYSSVFNT